MSTLPKDRCLVSGQHLRIIDRTVMMYLRPSSVLISPKDATGPNRELHRLSTHIEFTPFTPDHVKQIAGFVHCVVIELKAISALALEQFLVCWPDFGPASFYSSQRIIHRLLGGIGPISLHQFQVAGVESSVKLRKCLSRFPLIVAIFASSNWRLDGIIRAHRSPPFVRTRQRLDTIDCADQGRA